MPTYNYECISCKGVVSLIQKMSDPALQRYNCKTCNKEEKVRRIISGGSGMIFKGSGSSPLREDFCKSLAITIWVL